MRIDNKTTIKNKPLIDIVYILDSSGSMYGEKYNNALEGLKTEFKLLSENTESDYSFSLNEFSNVHKFHFFVEKNVAGINNLLNRIRCISGSTCLNDAIVLTLEKIKKEKREGSQVLVNILTDGEEYGSYKYTAFEAANKIKECQKLGFTITFSGTKQDTQNAIQRYQIDESNTITHDNTGEGIKKMSLMRSASTVLYSKKLMSGEDVSKNFYN